MLQRPRCHVSPGVQRVRAERQKRLEHDRNDDDTRRLLKRRHYGRFAKMILATRPTCQDCERAPSKHVHHVRKLRLHHEDLCDAERVTALCSSCHGKRTAKGE